MKKKEISIKLVWKQGELKKFWAFMTERHNIWYRRFVLLGKRPWTKDHVLSKYKFCNVFRNLDAGSQYVYQNITGTRYGLESVIFNVMLYRLFNLPYTYELLGGFNEVGKLGSFKSLSARLVDAKNRGYRLFNDAYLTAPGNELHGRIKAVGYLEAIHKVQQSATCLSCSVLRDIAMSKSMYDAWMLVRSCRFFGPFIAYQVVLDLMGRIKWPDKKTFVYTGPGAKSSIDSFLEPRWLSKLKPAKEKHSRMYIERVYDEALPKLTTISEYGLHLAGFGWEDGVNWADKHNLATVDIHDIEFCCCEYRKYRNIKAMLKGGRRVKLRTYKAEVQQLSLPL